jgi:hypothetical protein
MAFLATAIGSALTWAGERVLTWAESALLSALNDKAANRELSDLTAAAMTVAVGAAPELAEDLQSASFLQDVVAPIVIDRLRSPALVIAPDQLSRQYIDRFVVPWVRQGDRATTLARVFSSDESRIDAVMLAFVQALRQTLFASHHWRDVGRDRTIEETHARVSELVALQQPSPPPEGLSIATARADAVLASQDLLDWQRTIGGLFIERPELDQLLTRIAEEPRGRTLLVGEAGAGKSALLSELTERLQTQGFVVFGLKADMLPAEIASQTDLAQALGLQAELETELSLLAAVGPVVLIC